MGVCSPLINQYSVSPVRGAGMHTSPMRLISAPWTERNSHTCLTLAPHHTRTPDRRPPSSFASELRDHANKLFNAAVVVTAV